MRGLVSVFGEDARCDESVAAVVAWPGNDRNVGRPLRHRCTRNRASRALHQVNSRRAGGNRATIRFGHLRRGEKFDQG